MALVVDAPLPRHRPRRDRVALLDRRRVVLRRRRRHGGAAGLDPARFAGSGGHGIRRRRRAEDASRSSRSACWAGCTGATSRPGSPSDPGDGRAFARLAVVEIAVMGAATGLAAVLARSVPPVPDAAPEPSRILELTGFPDPGPMIAGDWLTAWRIDWLFARHRGRWPWASTSPGSCGCAGAATPGRCGRTICWVLGWALFVWATCGAPGHLGAGAVQRAHGHAHGRGDDRAAAPRARGAPVTLALRALKAAARQDVGAARGAAPGGALPRDAGAGQPGRGGGACSSSASRRSTGRACSSCR